MIVLQMSDSLRALNPTFRTVQNRRLMGRIHPSFMGGEYLPNTGRQEVEITAKHWLRGSKWRFVWLH